MFEEPHHPDAVERLVREREGERIGLHQRCLDSGALQMTAGVLELLRLDVDAGEIEAGEFLPEHRQDSAHAGTDLEQACAGLELGAVSDQPVPPVLRLLDEPFLLGSPVAVDVLAHPARRTATTGRLKPFSCSSGTGSVAKCSSTAACARWLTRISPGPAASLSRCARMTALPIAP